MILIGIAVIATDENQIGQVFKIGCGLFHHIGQPINNLFQQTKQNRLCAIGKCGTAFDAPYKGLERDRIRIAHCYQSLF